MANEALQEAYSVADQRVTASVNPYNSYTTLAEVPDYKTLIKPLN
jgi:hypothetical protein